MNFENLTCEYNNDTGAHEIDVELPQKDVSALLSIFYDFMRKQYNFTTEMSFEDIDTAVAPKFSEDYYRELRRDFVTNKAMSDALKSLDIQAALTPQIHVLDYPEVGKNYRFSLAVTEQPRFTLSSYEPVRVHMDVAVATDEALAARIQEYRNNYAEFIDAPDKPVSRGDVVLVNSVVLKNGEPFSRYSGERLLLEVTESAMPEPFINEVCGMDIGETKEFDYSVLRDRAISDNDVDTYQAKVTVIKQQEKVLPELTDEWVREHHPEISSREAFIEAMKEDIEAEVNYYNADTLARLANNELSKRLEGKIPDAFYQASRKRLIDKLEEELAQEGKTLDDYYEEEHINEEEFNVRMLIKSGENLRQAFALEELFDGRHLSYSEKDIQSTCQQVFGPGTYQISELEQNGKLHLVESATKRMIALNWLTETAIVES